MSLVYVAIGVSAKRCQCFCLYVAVRLFSKGCLYTGHYFLP